MSTHSRSITSLSAPSPSLRDLDYLTRQARWIRDELDLRVARDGPDALTPDEILDLDVFLRRLQSTAITARVDDLRRSRLHRAILLMTDVATRWPVRLVERADALREAWEEALSGLPLRMWPTSLYGVGGRLHGLCRPEDVGTEALLKTWLKQSSGTPWNPLAARKAGDLGFRAGDWWISPLFAFRDGIVDSPDANRGIVADDRAAYAILLSDDEEDESESPLGFTYRARSSDLGRHRLTSATIESRQPVRVLRSHTLRSFWSPAAGVRYDGLHKITGWSITLDPRTRSICHRIRFSRLPGQPPMDVVLLRPRADELEDYREYKRLRQIARRQQEVQQRQAARSGLVVTLDGTDALGSYELPDSTFPAGKLLQDVDTGMQCFTTPLNPTQH